jgi:hypothetical protein
MHVSQPQRFACECERCSSDAICEDEDLLFDWMCPERDCGLLLRDGDTMRCSLCGQEAEMEE